MRNISKALGGAAIASAVFLGGCAGPGTDLAWPTPRPLGRAHAVPRPPIEVEEASHRETAGSAEIPAVLGLEEALSLALERNPGLSSAGWSVRAGEARALQAGLLPNPELEAEVEEFAGSGDRRGARSLVATVGLAQTFQLSGKAGSRERAAGLESVIAGWEHETARIDLVADVTRDFAAVLAAQERLALSRELITLSESLTAAVRERVAAGKVSPLEETKARVSLEMSRIEERRSRKVLEDARARLASRWGSSSAKFREVRGEVESAQPPPDLESMLSRIPQSPLLGVADAGVEHRKAVLEREEAEQYPDLTIGTGVQYYNDNQEPAVALRGSIPIPLFDRNQGGVRAARYELARARARRVAVAVEIQREAQLAHRALRTAHAEVTILRDTVLPAARGAFEAANEGYRLGKLGFLDLLDAQRTLFEARRSYLAALLDNHLAAAELERWIGEPLATLTAAGGTTPAAKEN